MTILRTTCFIDWNDHPVLEIAHSTGYSVQHAKYILSSREQLDGLIVKLQALSDDMRRREPREAT